MASEESPIREPELDFLAVQNVSDLGLFQSLARNLHDLFFPAKQPPLKLTSRPLTRRELAKAADTVNLVAVQESNDESLFERLATDLRGFFSPAKQAPLHLTSRPLTPQELEAARDTVNFLGVQTSNDEGLFARLAADLRDALFPRKLPPLALTSKPVRMREIWGAYGYKKSSAAFSLAVHLLVLGAVITLSVVSFGHPKVDPKPAQDHVELILPPDIMQPVSAKKNDTLAGGGGGGDRDKLQAPKGKLPKFAMEQLTPPAMVLRNEHPKLTAEPTVVMPPEVKLPLAANMPNLGDPLSRLPSGPPSNGTGYGGGIGSGHGGGVGSGEGGGVGPGRGGGFGGGVFKVGGGVSAPKVLFSPDPDYSEEARKAKYQGVCVLWLIVGPDGRPRDIRVARTLGMGLDQKAVEAVRQWKFEPAMKDGQPVSVQINVEVNFRLY
jgi:TonB family protein